MIYERATGEAIDARFDRLAENARAQGYRHPPADWIAIEQTMEERIAARVAELEEAGLTHEFEEMPGHPRTCWACGAAKRKHLTKAQRQELEQLTYSGPAPRVLPRTNEVPF